MEEAKVETFYGDLQNQLDYESSTCIQDGGWKWLTLNEDEMDDKYEV